MASKTLIAPMQAEIRIEAATAAHLTAFPEIPAGWEGKALAAIKGDEILGICGALLDGDEMTVSMILSPSMSEHGFFFNRAVLRGIETLRIAGIKRIAATAQTPGSADWLRRLGFHQEGRRFIKCLA